MVTKFVFPDEQDVEADIKADATKREEDEIEIEIVDDVPEQDRNRPALAKPPVEPTDEELETYGDKVKARIKELTHARHDERRGREAVQREKQELENLTRQLLEENKQLKGYVATGTQEYATTLKAAAKMQLDAARAQYRAAQEAFDTEAIIAAQEALSEATYKMRQAEEFRVPAVQEAETQVQTRQPAPQQVQPDQKTLSWQAKNQWFGAPGYEDVTSYALGLHQKLVGSGVDPSSDSYFEAIDTRIQAKFPEVSGEPEAKPSSKKPSNVVAPAARATGPRKIVLTSTQIALAKKFNLTPQQYAAQVAKLEK